MSGTHQQDLKDSWSVHGGGKGSDTKEIGHRRPQKCQTSVFVKKIQNKEKMLLFQDLKMSVFKCKKKEKKEKKSATEIQMTEIDKK